MKQGVQGYFGVTPKLNPRYLPEGGAQIAENVEARGSSVKPLAELGTPLTSVSKTGQILSIYRFGQDIEEDDRHWFSWDTDVDVCRGQISGDPAEWTFYTGDGFPKATNSTMATSGDSTALPANYLRLGLPAPDSPPSVSVANPENNAEAPSVTLTPDILASLDLAFGVEVSGDFGANWGQTGPLPDNSPETVAAAINPLDPVLRASAQEDGSVVITATLTGGDRVIMVRWGPGGDQVMTDYGDDGDDLGLPESRVYVWTWVNIQDGLSMESAPSPASPAIDVYAGGTVTVGGFEGVPTESNVAVTHRRIYRTSAGVYLFVAEIPASAESFEDTLSADALGEELPSMDWAMPPETMVGLINLPNGLMAGFDGRDILFAEPYRPYAWPEGYRQAVDYPVVGLGRMDTTLAVLTEGTPYFIQGSAPDVMVVVQSDIAQACVAKRSIVSMNGAVYYASPDGLVMLSPNGSSMVTEAGFSREDWQALNPETIHAYGHDDQYIAFFGSPSTGGFLFDTRSGTFAFHTITGVTGGYADLRNDRLFLVSEDKQIRAWGEGPLLRGLWRSKIFSHPQITGYSCAQVEAEEYPEDRPVQCRVYADGALILDHAPTSRTPFRLPAVQARDWEFELFVTAEIFNTIIAQSMSEIASG